MKKKHESTNLKKTSFGLLYSSSEKKSLKFDFEHNWKSKRSYHVECKTDVLKKN